MTAGTQGLPPLQEAFEPPDTELGQAADAQASLQEKWPWHARFWFRLVRLFPVLLLSILALLTWWLLRVSAEDAKAKPAEVAREGPDYLMQQMQLQRFDPAGQLTLEVSGERMRHYPVGDRLEIDTVTVRAWGDKGQASEVSAQRAHGQAGLREVNLTGGVKFRTEWTPGQWLTVTADELNLNSDLGQLSAARGVVLTYGASRVEAGRMSLDYRQRVLVLGGQVRTTLAPNARP